MYFTTLFYSCLLSTHVRVRCVCCVCTVFILFRQQSAAKAYSFLVVRMAIRLLFIRMSVVHRPTTPRDAITLYQVEGFQ